MEAEVVNITKIKDGYFLGDEATAVNLDVILQFKITHMINAAGPQVQNSWESIGIKYLTLNWSESPNQSLFDPKDEVANRIVGFIDDSSKNGEGFLVHSLKGQNRACIVVLIYLVKKFRWSLKKCLDFLSSKKQDINIPNYFLSQLNAFEARLCKIGQGPKTSNWTEISTGNLNDIDNEELLIRNTYLNSLISNSVNEIISYSYKENKFNKKVNWNDQKGKNLVIPNTKKDLALMNPKEIKQLVYNKNVKPNKGCLKQSNNNKNESNKINKSFVNEKLEKSEIVNISVNKNNQSFKEISNENFNNDKNEFNTYFQNNTNNYQKNIKDKTEEIYNHQNHHSMISNHAFMRENSIKKKEFNNKENSLKNDLNMMNYRPNTSDNLNKLGLDINKSSNNNSQNFKNFEKEDKNYYNNFNNQQFSENKQIFQNRPNSGKNEKYDIKNENFKQNNIPNTTIRPQSVESKIRKPPIQDDNRKQFVPVQNIVNNNINNIYIQHEDIKKLIYQDPNKIQDNLTNNKVIGNSDKNNQYNMFNKNNYMNYNNPNYNTNNINTINMNNLNIDNNESSIKRNPLTQNTNQGIQNPNTNLTNLNTNNNNSKINKNSFNVQNKIVKNSETQNVMQPNMYYNQGRIMDNINNRINEKKDEGRGYYDEYDNSNFKTAYFNINDFKPINNNTNIDKNKNVKNEKENNRTKYVRKNYLL